MLIRTYTITAIFSFIIFQPLFSQDDVFPELNDSLNNVKNDTTILDSVEEFVAKESLGYNVGFTGSIGFVNGEYITNTPVGGSLVITSPFGFKVGPLNLNLSVVAGSYNGEVGAGDPLNALMLGVGANATLAGMVFSESHVCLIGEGLGVRNFSGVSLEKLLKKSLGLPVNVLVGGEGFLATEADETGNSTYGGGLGVRLDYNF